MRQRTASLSFDPTAAGPACSVAADLPIASFVELFADSPQSTVLIHDEQGAPLGVLQASDVLRRVDSPSSVERRRWLNLPVEAAMSVRLGRTETLPTRPDSACTDQPTTSLPLTTIFHQDSLIALSSGDDLFISWKSIQSALRASQLDPVTALPNRSAFEQQLAAEYGRAMRTKDSIAVILIDVDHFKTTNDEYGHAAGDFVLQSIATAIRQSLRSYDFVARYGGDEFAVICCGCRPGDIESPIQRIRRNVTQLEMTVPGQWSEKTVESATVTMPFPSISIGACVLHDHHQNVDITDLIARADDCLYEAKNAGRNRFVTRELGTASSSHQLVRGPRHLKTASLRFHNG